MSENQEDPEPTLEEMEVDADLDSPEPASEEDREDPEPNAEEARETPQPNAEEARKTPQPTAEEVHETPQPAAEEMDVDPPTTTYDSDEEGGVRIDEDIYIPPPPRKCSDDHAKGRLIISKIVNTAFKSYAGSVEVGPFHVCFSSVVGPNGSGKSNVIDSMLFVFGYRASRIRSKKISSLIHSSNEHPNCRSCTVAVHFRKVLDKPNGEYEDIPGSEMVISRTAFKDSSSYYQLNNRRVQFKEIAKLLRSEGVDLDHNRFLILQGEVEQIALMKPKGQSDDDGGMLEFLEDIIGTTRYKEPLAMLVQKIEILSDRLTEKIHRLKIAEKERNTLREPMQEAVNYLKLENQITKLHNKLLHCKVHEAFYSLQESEEAQQELKTDLNQLKEEMERVVEEKGELQKELKEKVKKWDAVQEKLDASTARFDEIQRRDEALHAEQVETNKRRKANKVSIKEEEAKLAELAKIPQKNAEAIAECEQLIEKSTAKKEKEEAALDKLMGSLKEQTEPLKKQRAELEKTLISLRKNVNEATATFDLAQSELQIYTSVEQKEKETLEKLKENLQKTAETLKNRREQVASFKTKIPKTEKSLNDARNDLAQAKAQEAEATAKLRDMRRQYEEHKSAMKASKERSKIVEALMQQKRENKLPGVVGRLGDLGAVDAKYDVAVSTACGPLDAIVVDTADTGEACIQFLRKYDIGRATFIVLEKQQHLIEAYQQPVQFPENVPRLFDLIKVEDESVLPAFYYALRNTLLAKDLDQASRIAYGQPRYRVVTLQGQVIESSGTMSGGGQPFRGRIGQKVVRDEPSAADMQKIEGDLDQLYEECGRCQRKQPDLEAQIRTLSQSLQEMTVQRDMFDIEVPTLQQQAESFKQQLKAQEKKAAESIADPERVEELTAAVDVARKNVEKTKKKSQSTEQQVATINNQIEEMSGGPVTEQQKKISNLAKAIAKARQEVCRLQVAINTNERDKQKTTQRIEQLQDDIESCENRIREIQQEKVQLEEAAKQILEEQKTYQEALKEKDAAGGTLKEQINSLQTRENKMKATKIDLDQKFKTRAQTIKELRQKINGYEDKIKSLKLSGIPEEPAEGLPEYSEEEVKEFDKRTVANNLAAAKERLPQDIPNMQTIKDYLEKDAVFMQRSAEVKDASDARNKMRGAYDEARRRRLEEFHVGFDAITSKLKAMYQMITQGGAAELEFVDSLDPFSEGINFTVRPPKKSWKNITNLSGGEKTLSSLALIFALHHYKPTPLYFMDEIDAALDFKNVSIVGRYIKDRTKNAQFIVISLRSEMFELADSLVGIYKTYNATKSATIDVKEFLASHPAIAQAEAARASEKRVAAPRVSLSQPAAGTRTSLGAGPSGPPVSLTQVPSTSDGRTGGLPFFAARPRPNQRQSEDQTEDSESEESMNVSMVSPPTPAKEQDRASVGSDTPLSSRRSLKDVNE